MSLRQPKCAAQPRSTAAFCDWIIESRRGPVCLVSAACFMSFIVGLGAIGLWGIREKRLAACVADIVYGHNWLVPNLCGRPRLEKPPLPYWIIASFSTLTGRLNEWVLRLPGVLAGLVILSVVYRLAADVGERRAGLLASLFLVTSPFYAGEVRRPSSDLFLACFAACTLFCWWRGYILPASRLGWWSAAGLWTGFGQLAKGPVALAVIGPPIVGLLVWQREFRLPRSRQAWAGILVAALLGAAWPLAVSFSHDGAWIRWILELDAKIGQRHPASDEGMFSYVFCWPQYLFPWTVFSVSAFFVVFCRKAQESAPAVRFAWLWFFGNLVAFSLPSTHKAYYLLAALPGLAVLSGVLAARVDLRFREQRETRTDRVMVHTQFLLLVISGIGVAGASLRVVPAPLWIGVWAGGIASVVCCVCWRIWPRRSPASAWVTLSMLAATMMAGAHVVAMPQLERYKSHFQLSRQIAEMVPTNARIFVVGEPDPSFWFYLKGRPQQLSDCVSQAALPANSYLLVHQPDRDLQTALLRHAALLRHVQVLLTEEDYIGSRALLVRTLVPLRRDDLLPNLPPDIAGSTQVMPRGRKGGGNGSAKGKSGATDSDGKIIRSGGKPVGSSTSHAPSHLQPHHSGTSDAQRSNVSRIEGV